MCYAPSKKTVDFAKRAQSRIAEGRLPEAERLLNAAIQQGGGIMNVRWTDGRRVGEHVEDTRIALLRAMREQSGR